MEIEFYDEVIKSGYIFNSRHEELWEQIEIVVMIKPSEKPISVDKLIRMLRKDILEITSTLSRVTKPLPAIEPTNPNTVCYPFKVICEFSFFFHHLKLTWLIDESCGTTFGQKNMVFCIINK